MPPSLWSQLFRRCLLESPRSKTFSGLLNKMFFSLYAAVLFFVLTPGVLVSLPPGGSRLTVALTHAVVFGVVFALTGKVLRRALGF